jgi:hypothetical protein
MRTFNFTRVASVVCAALTALVVPALSASAQFSVPSDGSDGAFNPTSNIQIDLGTAKTATWDTPADYNLQGVYDPEQWIVVYKFTSVNIPANVTVTFKNHPKNPPVVWLVQGDVTINGTVNLDGQLTQAAFPFHKSGGPGGFRGGKGDSTITTGGFGWGASNANNGIPSTLVGNAGCFPLVGGSGGSFYNVNCNAGWWALSGGGGAILIASNTKVIGTGSVLARSNKTGECSSNGGGGGSVRVVAPLISIPTITASGSFNGRIRLEGNSVTVPNTVPAYSGAPLPSNFVFLRHALTPSIRVVSIGGVSAPSDPTGQFASPTDVVVPNPQVQIVLECKNVPTNSTVQVELRSATNTNFTTVNATLQSGNLAQSTWIATGNLGTSLGYATVMARAVLPNP